MSLCITVLLAARIVFNIADVPLEDSKEDLILLNLLLFERYSEALSTLKTTGREKIFHLLHKKLENKRK